LRGNKKGRREQVRRGGCDGEGEDQAAHVSLVKEEDDKEGR
jgi:hypothetical protein